MFRTCIAAMLGLLTVVPALAADGDANAGTPTAAAPFAAAPPSRGPILPVLYGTLTALQIYDGWTTATSVGRGAVETNPVMASVALNPGAMTAVKAGVTSASIYTAERLWRRHRRAEAIATMVVVNGMMAAVAVRNGAVLNSLK